MNKNKDFEFLSPEEAEKINEKLKSAESIELPSGLSAENIEELVKNIPQLGIVSLQEKPKKNNKKKIAIKSIAAAAAVIVAISSVALLRPWEAQPKPVSPQESVIGAQPSSENYEEIEARFAEYAKKYKSHYRFFGMNEGFGVIEDAVAGESINSSVNNGSSFSDDKSFGKTNEQVSGVSEADIIKNDGKYLYLAEPSNADWEKYYAEVYLAYEDTKAQTTSPDGASSTPSYNPEAEKEGASVDKKSDSDKAPVLEYDCFISVVQPDAGGKMKKISGIEIKKPENDEIFYMEIQELYITGGRLVAILNCGKYPDAVAYADDNARDGAASSVYSSVYYGNQEEVSLVVCYDISNLSEIKEEWRIYQEGAYASSRLIGDELVFLSNYYVDISENEEAVKATCVPEIAYNGCDFQRIQTSDICIMEEVRDSRYLVASVIDIKNKDSVKTKAVLGGGENVYCTTETLYVAGTEYSGEDAVKEIFGASGNQITQIYKFDIRNCDIKYLKNAAVSGSALNQFSIDEYNGYLRIATTLGTWGDNLTNQVYILNESLETVGLLKGIAPGERIQSVRFTGETAYVVTFVQTDPLFVIDLSEPSAPRILGELKIPGYSAYLHPVAEGLVMGIGLDGTESGTNGGFKASLFDVSDPTRPVECDKFVLSAIDSQMMWEHIYSPAYYSHKAVCWDEGERVMYIPYTKSIEILVNADTYEYKSSDESGIIALKVDAENKRLVLNGTYMGENAPSTGYLPEFERVTYIEDIVFGYSRYNAALYSFDKATAEKADILELAR